MESGENEHRSGDKKRKSENPWEVYVTYINVDFGRSNNIAGIQDMILYRHACKLGYDFVFVVRYNGLVVHKKESSHFSILSYMLSTSTVD